MTTSAILLLISRLTLQDFFGIFECAMRHVFGFKFGQLGVCKCSKGQKKSVAGLNPLKLE